MENEAKKCELNTVNHKQTLKKRIPTNPLHEQNKSREMY